MSHLCFSWKPSFETGHGTCQMRLILCRGFLPPRTPPKVSQGRPEIGQGVVSLPQLRKPHTGPHRRSCMAFLLGISQQIFSLCASWIRWSWRTDLGSRLIILCDDFKIRPAPFFSSTVEKRHTHHSQSAQHGPIRSCACNPVWCVCLYTL